jgi:hypothetical protein
MPAHCNRHDLLGALSPPGLTTSGYLDVKLDIDAGFLCQLVDRRQHVEGGLRGGALSLGRYPRRSRSRSAEEP